YWELARSRISSSPSSSCIVRSELGTTVAPHSISPAGGSTPSRSRRSGAIASRASCASSSGPAPGPGTGASLASPTSGRSSPGMKGPGSSVIASSRAGGSPGCPGSLPDDRDDVLLGVDVAHVDDVGDGLLEVVVPRFGRQRAHRAVPPQQRPLIARPAGLGLGLGPARWSRRLVLVGHFVLLLRVSVGRRELLAGRHAAAVGSCASGSCWA